MFGTVCHLKLLILAYYDYLKELLSLWIFRIFRNVFSFLIMLCACVRVCFSVFFCAFAYVYCMYGQLLVLDIDKAVPVHLFYV